MSAIASTAPKSRWLSWILMALVALLTLAPWWHNRVYVRSFFDYGLVIGGTGRIEAGQRPYVDFISPAQAGWFFLNRTAEQLGGGTYLGMTLGGAAAILVALAVFTGMLARRWPPPAAMLVAGALVCATVSQHTLLWYNPWGVVWLVVAAWAGAVAPVLRREHLGWHALAAAALFFGGINKINMQLMALALVSAWAVRAGLTGRAGWGRVGLTLLFYPVCAILPVLAELAWTGASFASWWHNVVALPAGSRSGMALRAFAPEYLFTPFNHHYEGTVLLPAGLIGLILTLLTLAAILRQAWREGGWWEKSLPIGCAAVAYAAGVVLMATNMDIVNIALGGWIGLLVALWLGHGLPARGAWFYGGLVVPTVLIGAVAWHSAWLGQRSQFGHSRSPRASYMDAGGAGPEFAYFRGTRLPPETVESLREMAAWRRSLPPGGQAGHFFGPGTEWAAHIWPAMRTPDLPLSVYWQPGNSDARTVVARLAAALEKGEFRGITVSGVLDHWEGSHRLLLDRRYGRIHLGTDYFAYTFTDNAGVAGAPVWFTQNLGGNADSRDIVTDSRFLRLADGRMFLGVEQGEGMMKLAIPANRLQGEVVVRRQEGAPREAVAVEFAIYAQPDAATRYDRWRERVVLPHGQDEVIVPYAIDGSGMPTTFTVAIAEGQAGMVAAGWRGPRITHVGRSGPAEPAWLFHGRSEPVVLDERALALLLPDAWRPEQAFMRNGRVTQQGIELLPGGEIWLKTTGFVTAFAGLGKVEHGWDASAPPLVRGMWYLGGRLEVISQLVAREHDHAAEFRAWCAEAGGWLIIAVDPTANAPAVRVRVHEVRQQ
jgi:hypothetical protein